MYSSEVIPQAAVKIESDAKSSSVKANWLSNIMSVVKSPAKNVGEPKTPKNGRKSTEQSTDNPKLCTQENSSHRNRKESRIALRVERRMSRSSSLDTVSTCLSQDSINNPYNSVRAANAV